MLLSLGAQGLTKVGASVLDEGWPREGYLSYEELLLRPTAFIPTRYALSDDCRICSQLYAATPDSKDLGARRPFDLWPS